MDRLPQSQRLGQYRDLLAALSVDFRGVYIPPEDTGGLVANGVGELEFSLPGPLSLIFGTSLDYTRTPVVESWENLDSELYLRLRL